MVPVRIVGLGEEPPDQLLAHPLNFRRHPGAQMEALRASLRELGWVLPVLVNKTTGHVVDGHARVEEALRQGLPAVPVLYVNLSAEEENLALASLDPISGLAYTDNAVLAQLSAEVKAWAEAEEKDLGALSGLLSVELPDPDEDDAAGLLADEKVKGEGAVINGGEHEGATLTKLRWGKSEVPLTQDEREGLEKLLAEYRDSTGAHFGFVAWVLDHHVRS